MTASDQLWEPQIFDASVEQEREQLETLRSGREVVFEHDTIKDQLRELLATRDPAACEADRRLEQIRLEAAAQGYLDGASAQEYGRWIYYPWSRRLVHLLPPQEYAELRSDRNRPRIEEQQQLDLARASIGIVGLSVGSSTALTLALEGVGGHFRLADHDELSLSNMNRLRTGVHNIGVPKAVMAAREMFEINPYLDIVCFHEGIHAANVERFLVLDGQALDLVIEECDEFEVKLLVREAAKARRIPVLMETSDRGMVDLENYRDVADQEVFEGRLQGVTSTTVGDRDKVELGLEVLGEKNISEDLSEALVEMAQGKLTNWPQLASAVTLGGAVNTDVARRLLLGELCCSGRFYVDLEQIIRCPEPEPPVAATPSPSTPTEVLAELVNAGLDSLPRGDAGLRKSDVDFIVDQGTKAPSAGNSQPWRFIYHHDRLLCLNDPAHAWTLLDYEGRATALAHGAAVQNMVLAAAHLGFEAKVLPLPLQGYRDLLCLLTFAQPDEKPTATPDLTPLIHRRTNRNKGVGQPPPLQDDDKRTLRRAARAQGGELHLVTGRQQISTVGKLIGQCDRLTLVSEELFRELTAELRWTPEEVQRTRDGIDVKTLELAGIDEKLLSMLCHHRGLPARMARRGAGPMLEMISPKWVEASSAVGLLTVEGEGLDCYLQGGRALEAMWLAATELRILVHPMTALVYLFARLAGGGEGFNAKMRRKLEAAKAEFDKVFPVEPGHAAVLLFRLGLAGKEPSGPALRRHLEDVLTYLG